MAYDGDFNNLSRRTVSDKVLSDKTFNIAKNVKYDGYQRDLASILFKFFLTKNLLALILQLSPHGQRT